jgi:predicted DNA repair protein MutK
LSGGLAALLDDIAVLARAAAASIDDVGVAAAKAGSKAAGVVIDDAAVTPQYVRGLAAERELPIVKRIAIGSLRNKFLIILPVILLLSQFLPWLLTPILMLGGAYLCYEGAEKVWAKVSGHGAHGGGEEKLKDEKTLISGAVRTDLILSAEIMVISLNEVADQSFWSRLSILCVVALVMTVAVYGAVGIIVKMDDVGLRLAEQSTSGVAAFGRGLVKAMPIVLTALTVIGTAAMLWVGGHILLVGTDELGWHALYGFVHHIEVAAHDATGPLGGFVGWLVNTIFSAILGLIVGALLVVIITFTFHRNKDEGAHGTDHATDSAATTQVPADGKAVTPVPAAGKATTPTPAAGKAVTTDATVAEVAPETPRTTEH